MTISNILDRKEIIILGMGPTRVNCPYDAEVWACNNAYKQMTVCQKCHVEKQKTVRMKLMESWLECPACHSRSPIPKLDKLLLAHTQCWDAQGDAIFNWNELNELANRGVEIWNTHRVKRLKSRLLDWRRMSKKFGMNYFSNILAFMIARAIDIYTVRDKQTGLLKFTQPIKLKLYGCDMQTFDEYGSEKGSMESWLMYGKALGMEFEVAPGGLIFETKTGKPYGEKYFSWKNVYMINEKGERIKVKMKRGKTDTDVNHAELDKIITPGRGDDKSNNLPAKA